MKKAQRTKTSERELQELAEGLRRAKQILSKIPDHEIVRAAREGRAKGRNEKAH